MAISPTRERIGKQAAIAVNRTRLNYFLGQEMKDECEATDLAPRDLRALPPGSVATPQAADSTAEASIACSMYKVASVCLRAWEMPASCGR